MKPDNPRSFVEIAQAHAFDEIRAIEQKMSSKVARWNQLQGEAHSDVEFLLEEHARSHAREMQLAELLDQAVAALKDIGYQPPNALSMQAQKTLASIESGRAKLLLTEGRK